MYIIIDTLARLIVIRPTTWLVGALIQCRLSICFLKWRVYVSILSTRTLIGNIGSCSLKHTEKEPHTSQAGQPRIIAKCFEKRKSFPRTRNTLRIIRRKNTHYRTLSIADTVMQKCGCLTLLFISIKTNLTHFQI